MFLFFVRTSAKDELAARQAGLLKWLMERQRLGLVTDDQIRSWKDFFQTIPETPRSTFPFYFPVCERPQRTVESVSLSSSNAASRSLTQPQPRTQIMSTLSGIEQRGPLAEAITYPGYSRKDRKREQTKHGETGRSLRSTATAAMTAAGYVPRGNDNSCGRGGGVAVDRKSRRHQTLSWTHSIHHKSFGKDTSGVNGSTKSNGMLVSPAGTFGE